LSWLIDNLLKGTLPDGFTESRTSLRYVSKALCPAAKGSFSPVLKPSGRVLKK